MVLVRRSPRDLGVPLQAQGRAGAGRTPRSPTLDPESAAPLPRFWGSPEARTDGGAGFVQRVSAWLGRHDRAVAAVMLGAAALPGCAVADAAPVDRVDLRPSPSEVRTGEGLARAHLFDADAGARGDVAPAVLDVSAVGSPELARLGRSPVAEERRLGETIARARVAYAKLIESGGRVIASTSPGNGGYPVLTLVPAGFDAQQPARVQTHYHGWHATVADPRGHGAGLTARIADVQAQDRQAVFVLPECKNAPANGGFVRTDWSNVTSQAGTTEDALRGAGVQQVDLRVVSAHSGGGSAVALAAAAHSDGSGLRADRLELHDSLYGSEHPLAAWASTAGGQAVREVRYFRGTNDASAGAPLAGAFGSRYRKEAVAAPRVVPVIRDDRGRSVRRYDADAHNRTVAEHLGSRG